MMTSPEHASLIPGRAAASEEGDDNDEDADDNEDDAGG